MTILRAYKVELDPTIEQRKAMERHVYVARKAYNWALGEWRTEYAVLAIANGLRACASGTAPEVKEKQPSWQSLHKKLTPLKKTPEFICFSQISSYVVREAVKDVGDAYKHFFRRIKEGKSGKAAGAPRFRSAKFSPKSFHCDQGNELRITDKKLKIPGVGWIKLKEHGYIPYDSSIRLIAAGISKVAGRWYASVRAEVPTPIIKSILSKRIGIDLGLTTFATLSDGRKIESPKPLKKALASLRRIQRSYSRKQKGSKNQRKVISKIAIIHARAANIRNDFVHKTTTNIVKKNSEIAIENLNVKGMVQNKHLSRSIADAAWGMFREQLTYKSKWCNRKLDIVSRWFPSSKMCSACNYIMTENLKLSIRKWKCPTCGAEHDRDINAAINIANPKDFVNISNNIGKNGGGIHRQKTRKGKKTERTGKHIAIINFNDGVCPENSETSILGSSNRTISKIVGKYTGKTVMQPDSDRSKERSPILLEQSISERLSDELIGVEQNQSVRDVVTDEKTNSSQSAM